MKHPPTIPYPSRAEQPAMPAAAFTPQELDAARGALVQRLQALRDELAADRDKLRRDAGAGEVIDRKEEAAGAAAADVASAEWARDLAEITDVRAALDRIAAGTYGHCIACGEPIARERLRVQPAAPRCSACQAATERGARGG
jgi:DnaK suppressor protein